MSTLPVSTGKDTESESNVSSTMEVNNREHPTEKDTSSKTSATTESSDDNEGDDYFNMYLAVAKALPGSAPSRDEDAVDSTARTEQIPSLKSAIPEMKLKECSVNIGDVPASDDSPSTLDPRVTRRAAAAAAAAASRQPKSNSAYIQESASPVKLEKVNWEQQKEIKVIVEKTANLPAVKARGVQPSRPQPPAQGSSSVSAIDTDNATTTPKIDKPSNFRIPKKQIIPLMGLPLSSLESEDEESGWKTDTKKRTSVWGPPKKLRQGGNDRYFGSSNAGKPPATTSEVDEWGDPVSGSQPPKISAESVDDSWNTTPVKQNANKVADDGWGDEFEAPKVQNASTSSVTVGGAPVDKSLAKAPDKTSKGSDDEWGDNNSKTKTNQVSAAPAVPAGGVDEWGEPLKAVTSQVAVRKDPPKSGNVQETSSGTKMDVDEWGEPAQPASSKGSASGGLTTAACASGSTIDKGLDEWGEPIKTTLALGAPKPENVQKPSSGTKMDVDDWGEPVSKVAPAASAKTPTPANEVDEWGEPVSKPKSAVDWGAPKPLVSSNDDWGAPKAASSTSDDWGAPATVSSGWGNSASSSDWGGGGGGDSRGRGRGRGGGRGRGNGERGRGRGGGGRGGGNGDRERSGGWDCSCGVNNFSFRQECFKCHTPKPEGAGSESSSSSNNDWGGNGGGGGRGGWKSSRDNPNNEPVAKRPRDGDWNSGNGNGKASDDWGTSAKSSAGPAADDWSTPSKSNWGTSAKSSADDWSAPNKSKSAASSSLDEWSTPTPQRSSVTSGNDWGSGSRKSSVDTGLTGSSKTEWSSGVEATGESRPGITQKPPAVIARAPPKQLLEWTCTDPRCGSLNFDFRDSCNLCGARRGSVSTAVPVPVEEEFPSASVFSRRRKHLSRESPLNLSPTNSPKPAWHDRIKAPPKQDDLHKKINIASVLALDVSDKVEQVDASTETPNWSYGIGLKDYEHSIFHVNQRVMPLGAYFEAVSQCAGGGIQVEGTIIWGSQAVTAPKPAARAVEVKPGVFIETPRTRNKVRSKWPSFNITLIQESKDKVLADPLEHETVDEVFNDDSQSQGLVETSDFKDIVVTVEGDEKKVLIEKEGEDIQNNIKDDPLVKDGDGHREEESRSIAAANPTILVDSPKKCVMYREHD